jgi:nicotinate-nucleotide pyrophosphorylase (carboxylating)
MSAQALPKDIARVVAAALTEDIGKGDLTAALVPASQRAKAHVVSRESAVVCGRAWFDEVFRQLDPTVQITWTVADGTRVEPDAELCSLEGPARPILTGERSALNFLQTLSGTATAVAAYVARVQDTGVQILDTRKTLPGLRAAQKYAVRCGGGTNHRHGLYDGILIKENHILAAGSLSAAVHTALAMNSGVIVQVETETLAEVEEALSANADMLLLDNFPLEQLREAVAIRDSYRGKGRQVVLEASGNIDLDNVRAVAETGVDRISVGGLTKHLHAVDLSMRFSFAGSDASSG